MFGDPVGLCLDMLHDNPAAGNLIVVDNDKSAGLGDIGGKVKGDGLERLKHAFGHIVPLDLLTIGVGSQFRGIKHRLNTPQPHGHLSAGQFHLVTLSAAPSDVCRARKYWP